MIGRVLRRALLVATFIALPALGHAQEAVLTGTVTDSTGGVLPGVTVTAPSRSHGKPLRGDYRCYRELRRRCARRRSYVTAELQGSLPSPDRAFSCSSGRRRP